MKKIDADNTGIRIVPEEAFSVSNKDVTVYTRKEYIREQMVRLNTNNEAVLSISESDQFNNQNLLSTDYIREKMIFG